MSRLRDVAALVAICLAGNIAIIVTSAAADTTEGKQCAADLASYLATDTGRWALTGTRQDGTTYKNTLHFSMTGGRLSGRFGTWPFESVVVRAKSVSFRFTSSGRKGARAMEGELSCRDDGTLAGVLTGPSSRGGSWFEDEIRAVPIRSAASVGAVTADPRGGAVVLHAPEKPALWLGDRSGNYADVEAITPKAYVGDTYTINFVLDKVPESARLVVRAESISTGGSCVNGIYVNDKKLGTFGNSGLTEMDIGVGVLKNGGNRVRFTSEGCRPRGRDDYLIHAVTLSLN